MALGGWFVYLAVGTSTTGGRGALPLVLLGGGGAFIVCNGIWAAYLWAVGWGFTADDVGLHLRRGRSEESVAWATVRDLDHHGGVGWTTLRLRPEDRTVIIPNPAATTRAGDLDWHWVRLGEGWRVVARGTVTSPGHIDGDWVRRVHLGTARRGYDVKPVADLLARCADTIDALSSPDLPATGQDLVTPDEIRSFEVAIARDGADPAQVDDLLERIEERLAELHDRRRHDEPGHA